MQKVGLQLDSRITVIVDTPFLRYLKRTLGKLAEDLVTYYVISRKRYCLGIWRDRISGHVHEIKSWSTEADLKPDTVRFIQYFLSNERRRDVQRCRRSALEEHRKELRKCTDASEAKWDRWKFQQSRTNIHKRGDLRTFKYA